MDADQTANEVAAFLESTGCRVGTGKRSWTDAQVDAAIPSLWVAAVVIAAGAAVGVLGRRAMRRTIFGDKVSYERYERHTPGCLEVYERFERGTMVVQRG